MPTRTSEAAAGLLLVAGILLAPSPAQAFLDRKRKPDPAFAAAQPIPPAPPMANGAIFQAVNGYAPLTSGARAAQVGDVVTIILAERTQATKSNSASTDRNGNIGLTPPSAGPLSLFRPAEATFGGGGKFAGQGGAEQSNQLNGEISVTVQEVRPNGTMLVRGEKLMRLNRGDEYVQIAGLIRPADISFDNRVLSSRVADAQITYSGSGEIARASRQGWLNRFFSIISPF